MQGHREMVQMCISRVVRIRRSGAKVDPQLVAEVETMRDAVDRTRRQHILQLLRRRRG